MGENGLGGSEHRRSVRVDAVERPCPGEALELASVEQARIDSGGKILEAGDRPPPLALDDQSLHRLFANALKRAERVPPRSILDRKMSKTGVDVGRQTLDPATADILDERGQL